MTAASASVTFGPDVPDADRVRLAYPIDADVCVIGAGLAGLSVALEAARLGASVVVLEGRHVGWNASGNQMGTVMPGFGLPLADLIARVGLADAREMWSLSRQGAEAVRARATGAAMADLALSDGALEVSNVDVGERLIARLQMLNEDFDTEAEGWQIERVRDALKTKRYFHGVHYPKAFQIDGRNYLMGLAALAKQAGIRIFEDTPALSLDAAGIMKRVVTPAAKLRAQHVVLAGNVHLGPPAQRLSDTLLPVWRYAGITEPLGDRLAEAIAFTGSVSDSDGVDHFRIVAGDRLMWSSPETTWATRPDRFARAIASRIRTVFPQLGKLDVTETFGGAVGQTVHGMPQIGQIRPGLWVASGFGYQGLSTTAMAGQLIASGMMQRDDRSRLFAPFELVWAGGKVGRAVGYGVGVWHRQASALQGTMARYRERAAERERRREARLAAANARAGTGGPIA
ncbi:MAG: FAD-binding oxidoreductase [Tardiphaga sp.]